MSRTFERKKFLNSFLALVITIFLVSVVLTPVSGTVSQKPEFQVLHGSLPKVLSEARYIGFYPVGNEINLTIGLTPKNLETLKNLIQQQSDPRSPLFHKYLSVAEFDAMFAPSDQEIRQIENYYASQGFIITNTWPDHLGFDAKSTVLNVEKSLNIQINRYSYKDQIYYSNAQDPSVPVQFHSLISGISGLSNFAVYKPLLVLPHKNISSTIIDKVSKFSYHSPFSKITTAGGYTAYDPSDIRTAYDVNQMYAHGYTGNGVSIAIVGVGTPTQSDVNGFASTFLGKSSVSFNVVNIDGTSPYPDPYVESTLDIEWSLAMAPNASITMVMGANPSNEVFNDMYAYVVNTLKPQVMSVSWGLDEYDSGAQVLAMNDYLFMQGAAEGISMFAASGDSGAYDQGYYGLLTNQFQPIVDFPASDPYITGSGGTSLYLYTHGSTTFAYQNEYVWGGGTPGIFNSVGSGGGYSMYFSEPSWQYYAQTHGPGQYNGMRGVPDLAFNANPYTGDWVYYSGSLYGPIGGTSIAAPELAGIFALYDQMLGHWSNNNIKGVGFVNPAIYSIAANTSMFKPFNDIVFGSNGYYSANVGWDPTTGLGSPIVYNLAMDLLLYFNLTKAFAKPQCFITLSTPQTLTNSTIYFNGTEVGGNYTSLTYKWNFGDSKIISGQNVTHSYLNSGFYTVNLTVKGYNSSALAFTVNANTKVNVLNAGILVLTAPAGSQAYVDGSYIGAGSLIKNLSAGVHLVYVDNSTSTNMQFSKLITVKSGKITDLNVTLYPTSNYTSALPNLQYLDSMDNFYNSYEQWLFSPSFENYSFAFNPHGGLYTYYYGDNSAGTTNVLGSDGNYIFGLDEMNFFNSSGFIIQVGNLSLPSGNISHSDYMLNRLAIFDPYTYSELALQQVTSNGVNYTELVYRYNLNSYFPKQKIFYYQPSSKVTSFTLYTDGANNLMLWSGLSASGKALYQTSSAGMSMVLANLVYRSLYAGTHMVYNSVNTIAIYSVDTGVFGYYTPTTATVLINNRAPMYSFSISPTMGFYYSPLNSGNYTLSASAPGYQTVEQTVSIAWNQVPEYDFYLNGSGSNFVSFTSPLNGSTVSGLVAMNISVGSTNTTNYSKDALDLYLDGKLLYNLTSQIQYAIFSALVVPGPSVNVYFTSYWNSLTVTDGPHNLSLVARIYTNTSYVMAYSNITVFTLNYAKPYVSITSPSAGSVLSGAVNIKFNYDSSVAKAILTIDNQNIDVTGYYSYTWYTYYFPNGNHTVTLTVTSQTWVINQQTIHVMTNNNPSGSILTPYNNATLSGAATFKFSYSSDVKSAVLNIDNTSYTVTGDTNFYFNTAQLSNGMHTVKYTVTNAYGFVNTSEIIINTSNIPTITMINPQSNSTVSGQVLISFTVSGEFIESIYLVLDTGSYNVTRTNSYLLNTILLPDGLHYATLIVKTAAGTFTLHTLFKTLNYAAPTASLIVPSMPVSGNTTLLFNYAGNGIVSAMLTINDKSYNVTGKNSFALDTRNLANGKYDVTLTVKNSAGLITTKSMVLTVQNPGIDPYLILAIVIAILAIGGVVATFVYTKKKYTKPKRILEPPEKEAQ